SRAIRSLAPGCFPSEVVYSYTLDPSPGSSAFGSKRRSLCATLLLITSPVLATYSILRSLLFSAIHSFCARRDWAKTAASSGVFVAPSMCCHGRLAGHSMLLPDAASVVYWASV